MTKLSMDDTGFAAGKRASRLDLIMQLNEIVKNSPQR